MHLPNNLLQKASDTYIVTGSEQSLDKMSYIVEKPSSPLPFKFIPGVHKQSPLLCGAH